jgi:hypothetical protein
VKTYAALFLLSVVSVGCRAHTITPSAAELRVKLKAVTLSDGVSRVEAAVIARSYFARHIACGAYVGIHNGSDRWVVDAKFGSGGEPVKGFVIDKRSGKVTSPIGPDYNNPIRIIP